MGYSQATRYSRRLQSADDWHYPMIGHLRFLRSTALIIATALSSYTTERRDVIPHGCPSEPVSSLPDIHQRPYNCPDINQYKSHFQRRCLHQFTAIPSHNLFTASFPR